MAGETSNVTATTNLFSSMYVIGLTCSMNVFYFMITERHCNSNTKVWAYICKFW